MITLDSIIEPLSARFPALRDEKFKAEYPQIENIAIFIHDNLRTTRSVPGSSYPSFLENLGINNVNSYLNSLRNGNHKAVENYEKILRRI